ncbi:hypothetical protein AO263_28555 [Pseudomonas sp. NZIPFR-PS5]|nr:hypothetical protein AO263_28555 [Pseudomonas sp. NZIPFR-PS5]
MNSCYMKEFECIYSKGSDSVNRRVILTFNGLFNRIARSRRYAEELVSLEVLRINFGVGLLQAGIDAGQVSLKELKAYKAALKTINAKLKHRNDFIVIASGALVFYGLTSLASREHPSVLLDVFPSLAASAIAQVPSFFVLSMLVLTGVLLIERAAMLSAVARNEEIVNVIDSL